MLFRSNIHPFGEIIAKFDTGNGVYSVLHAEDIKISCKKITFNLKGKTITTDLVDTYEAETGAGGDKRPLVKLDVEFAGSMYKDVMFGLNDRSNMGTEVLFNRYVMSKLFNVMVNPARKYIVTTKYSLD